MQNRLVVVLGVVGIAFAGVSLVGPWWVLTGSSGLMVPATNLEYGLFGWSWSGPTVESDQAVTVVSSYSNLPRMGFVLFSGATLVALAMFSGGALAAVATVSSRRPSLRKWAAIVGILAALIVFAAAIEVTVFLPSAWGADLYPDRSYTPGFWAYDPTGPVTVGAGWAWYAVLVAAVLFLIAGLISFRTANQSAE